MKAVVNSKELVHAVRALATVIGPEVPVLITAIDGVLRLEAGTDGAYMRHIVEAEVSSQGAATLPVSRMIGVPFSGEKTTVSTNKGMITIASGEFSLVLKQSHEKKEVKAQRPQDMFKAPTGVSSSVLANAVSKVVLRSALPGADIGVKIDVSQGHLTLSTTDNYRAVSFKEDIALKQDEFSAVLQPEFLQAAISKVESVETNLGVHRGMFRLSTPTMDIFHPAIQENMDDVDSSIDGITDKETRECRVTVECSNLSKKVKEASSIQIGTLAYDTHFDLLIKGDTAHLRCLDDQGTAKTTLHLGRSDATTYLTKLSSKYVLEMLNLIKAGDTDISFWKGFVMFEGHEGKFRGLIPTVAA